MRDDTLVGLAAFAVVLAVVLLLAELAERRRHIFAAPLRAMLQPRLARA